MKVGICCDNVKVGLCYDSVKVGEGNENRETKREYVSLTSWHEETSVSEIAASTSGRGRRLGKYMMINTPQPVTGAPSLHEITT